MPFVASGMIGQARTDCADADAVDPAADDSVYLAKINKYYLLWHQKVERRIAEVSATTSGLTFSQGTKLVTITPTNWYEVVQAFKTSAAGNIYGTPLEVVKNPSDILRLQDSDSTQGTVAKIAFIRRASASGTDIGKWNAVVHPIPSASTTIGVLVRRWPTELASASDVPDITELAAYTISKLAAAEVAAIFGEDAEFIGNILRPVSDEVLSLIGVPRPGVKKPQPRPQEAMA